MATEILPTETFVHASDLQRPLCVALEGGLITARVTGERVGLLFRHRPWLAMVLPFWLLGGTASLRRRIRARIELDPATLPYRRDLLAALTRAREAGRTLVLAARTDAQLADSVARHVGLFDAVYTSEAAHDEPTPELRNQLGSAFPDGYDFVGHSSADIPALSGAARGYLVGASAEAKRAAERASGVVVLSRSKSVLKALVQELRPHQWAKNALVVLPVLLAPSIPAPATLGRGLLAAFTFSLCASAGYVFNDLLDLEADRLHAAKAKRPFASGALPIVLGFPLFIALLIVSFALAISLLPLAFVAMLAIYFVATLSYSLFLKRILLIDVLVLAGLYTHRILAGGIATDVHVSTWLLGFSMFLFTSLAFAKRYVELHALSDDKQVKNRGYFRVDLPMVTSMGTASGYIAALVFMLYVDSSAVRASYRSPTLLWLVLPALLYWLGRIWLLAGRGQMQEDPVKFALKDKKSLACVAVIGAIAIVARFTPVWLVALVR